MYKLNELFLIVVVSVGLTLLVGEGGYCRGRYTKRDAHGSEAGQEQFKELLQKGRKRREAHDFAQRLQRAQFYMQSGRYEEAITILERLVLEKPEVAQLAEMLSGCYLRAGRKEKTIEFCREKLKSFPMNYSLTLNLGQAYLLVGEKEKAVEAWRSLLSDDEMRAGFYGIVAKIEIENGLYEEAERTLREGLRFESFRNSYTGRLVRLLKSMGRFEDAFIENCSAVIRYGQGWGWRRVKDMIATSSYIDRERVFEIADSISTELPDDNPFPYLAKSLLYAAQKRYRQAYRMLEKMKKRKEQKAPFYMFMEYIADEQSRADSSYRDFFEKVLGLFVNSYPDSPESCGINFLRARVERERGKQERPMRIESFRNALKLAERAISCGRDVELERAGRIFKAQVLIEDLREFRRGIEELNGLNNLSRGDSLVVVELYSRAMIGLGRWKGADEFFNRIKSHKDSTFVVLGSYERGLSLFYRGKHGEALDELSALARRYPWSRWANDALSVAILIKRAFMENSTGALSLFSRASYLVEVGRLSEAMELFDSLTTRYPESFLAPYALGRKADIMSGLGRLDEEVHLLDRIAEKYPDSELAPGALERVAGIVEGLDTKKAIDLYGTIIERYPDYQFIERVRKRFLEMRKMSKGDQRG